MTETSLINQLPNVRGSYRENLPLSDFTWFRVGGPAQVVFKPADVEDLALFMKDCPKDIPKTVIGVGSNLLVRDGGLDGVVIRLGGKNFAGVTVDGNKISAGAAALDAMVAKQAAKVGLKGLGFLVGVPGTIGGALRMNAGAHGGETKDHLISATVVTDEGEVLKLTPEQIGHTYRSCAVPKSWIFVSAEFECSAGNKDELADELKHVQETREKTQPIKSRTGGSTFKNPPNNSSWKLVDEAGCRGLQVGGAMMSEMHCNFMLNVDQATADDLETLGETVRERVLVKTGIQLDWEIKRIGKKI